MINIDISLIIRMPFLFCTAQNHINHDLHLCLIVFCVVGLDYRYSMNSLDPRSTESNLYKYLHLFKNMSIYKMRTFNIKKLYKVTQC